MAKSPPRSSSPVHKAPAIVLTVQADGFASTLHRFFGPELEKPAGEATLVDAPGAKKSRSSCLAYPLQGMTWPKNVKPELYFSALRIKCVAPGWNRSSATAQVRFVVRRQHVERSLPSGRAWRPSGFRPRARRFAWRSICPAFCNSSTSGPFHGQKVKDGKLEIPVDKPVLLLDVEFDLGDSPKAAVFTGVMISLQWKNPATNRHLEIARTDEPSVKAVLKARRIVAGRIPGHRHHPRQVRARPTRHPLPPRRRSSSAAWSVRNNQHSLHAPRSQCLPRRPDGDSLHILKPDGSPLTGEKVTVILCTTSIMP